MIHTILKHGLYILLTSAFITSPLVQAADEPIDEMPTTRDDVLKLIDQGLPEPLRGDIGALVGKMMGAKIGPPLSQTFDAKLAISTLLGRGARLDPECRQVFTKSGDPDRLPCIASVGTADGRGAYKQLAFSKHMALGNVSFFDRPADKDIGIADLVPVKIPDDQAYMKAQDWLNSNLGLGPDEIPVAPDGVKNPYPVRTIGMAAQDEAGKMEAVEVEKLVMIRRGLFTGLGGDYDWIPAPGKAMAVMDDSGVKQAAIREWQEVKPDPNVDPRNAKTLDELKDEIADDLAGLMKGPINRILIGLSFGVRTPNDNKDLSGLLLPAVQVYVSSVPADLSEDEQVRLANTQVSTASVLREYFLVKFPDDHPVSDDE